MRSIAFKSVLGFVLFLHFGCATIIGTSRQTVSIDSDPKETIVTENQLNRQALTPTTFNFQKGGNVYLKFNKEGYEPTSIVLNKKIIPSFWMNLLFMSGAFVPMLVDAATGAMWQYDESVYVRLEPITPGVATGTLSHIQTPLLQKPTPQVNPLSLSGPRVGLLYLSSESVHKREAWEGRDISSLVTQFGWQFEYRLREGKPISLIYKLIPLMVGIDQDTPFFAIEGLLGIRTLKGVEFSVGPYVSDLTGTTRTAAVYNVERTWEKDGLSIPLSIAVIPRHGHYEGGTDYSLLTGFSW